MYKPGQAGQILSLVTLLAAGPAYAEVLGGSLILEQWVAQIRDKNTNPKDFREALEKIGEKLAEESMKHLNTELTPIHTPAGHSADHKLISEKPVLFTILRAGMPIAYGMHKVFPSSDMGFIGSARNEVTGEAKSSYTAIPTDVKGRVVIIGETMLATGGSLEGAIKIILKYEPRHVIVLCAIAAPEGIERLKNAFQEKITVIAAATDTHLDGKRYIVPGLGDAGDRAYGKKL